MDRDDVAGLSAELRAQLRLFARVYQRLQDRLALGLDNPAQLDSVAYQIHNLLLCRRGSPEARGQGF
jgi:hypothetical protein